MEDCSKQVRLAPCSPRTLSGVGVLDGIPKRNRSLAAGYREKVHVFMPHYFTKGYRC